jgi:hypothetical protein
MDPTPSPDEAGPRTEAGKEAGVRNEAPGWGNLPDIDPSMYAPGSVPLRPMDDRIDLAAMEHDGSDTPVSGFPSQQPAQAEDRALRRDIDRWLDDGMTADQYLTLRQHVARIREQAATEARRELLTALRETTDAFHAMGWHDRNAFGHRRWSFDNCPVERCAINRRLIEEPR